VIKSSQLASEQVPCKQM